jgi:hypothetical protein
MPAYKALAGQLALSADAPSLRDEAKQTLIRELQPQHLLRIANKRTLAAQINESLLPYSCSTLLCSDPAMSCLPPVVLLQDRRAQTTLMWDATVRHSGLFPEFPCDGELIPVEALSTEGVRLFWCSGCGTEFTFTSGSAWVFVVYPGIEIGPGQGVKSGERAASVARLEPNT